MPRVIHLQYGPYGGGPMVRCASLRLVQGWGIERDHHFRARSSRQVLLMAAENCELFGLAPGEVRENLVTRGIDLQSLPSGTRLRIGASVLEITKDCEPCPFIDTLRPRLKDRIGGRRGMLARVVETGAVHRGDAVSILP